MPPSSAAPPRAGPSPPDYAVAPPHHLLGFPPRRDPPLAGPLSGKPHHRSEAVLDSAEDDARTPGSAEFFLREPPESLDGNTALAHVTFTYEQLRQLNAQVYVSGDLRHRKPPAEHTMLHAFGEPAEGQKHVWQEVWRASVNRWESQKSIVPGYDTPPSSSLIGSCTSESRDTTVRKIVISEPYSSELHHNSLQHDADVSQVLDVGSARSPPEKHSEVLKQQNGEEAVIISEPKQHAGDEEASQVLDVGSARSTLVKHPEVLKQENGEEAVVISEPKQHAGGEVASQVLDVGSSSGPPEKYTVVLKQENGEEAVIITEPKQHVGGEEARQVVDVGSARSHPLRNITEHYCNLAFNDRGSETRSLSNNKPDPCVKCGKEGRLLKCRTCSLAAHGSCFGSFVRFDDSGLFDCPVCFFNKADEAYEKAKITCSEARKNLSAFFWSDQSVKQQNKNQSVKQGNYQSDAANISHKDEESGHEKRNDASEAYPEVVVAEKKTTFGPNPGTSRSSQEVPHLSHDRISPITDRNIEADKENGLMNSPVTHGRRVRFHIKETVVSRSYGKSSVRQDQFMHSPARKRYYAQQPEFHSSPATPPARSPIGSTRKHGTSTLRRKMTRWTRAEEAALREGMAKYLSEHPGAATGNRNISWVRILEDCAGSFNPVRAPCDLRKKWGRMKQQGRAL
uniref:Uncharacterized protein n=1 Tax=Avena sativa TaxID=4498 RepID=A0ACD5XMB8_AVESA